ncbi:hypothetical protein HD554DRAFT_1319597 [Boletus coccyginus]|nr:hypothetical protein HD554DRAFT_1319597 [Boletus coccyginus]
MHLHQNSHSSSIRTESTDRGVSRLWRASRRCAFHCSAMAEAKLLVIEEYREAMSNFRIDGPKYKKGACILGQPGIGKSCFVSYAVVELLRERQPVAVQVTWDEGRTQYILLSENGVHLHHSTDVDPLTSHPGIWAFSDSNDLVLVPTAAFTKTLGIRTFQTASPGKKRNKDWTKEAGVRLYFMDLWPTEEINDLAFISGLDISHASKLAEKWGPVPRILLKLCSTPEEEEAYQVAVKCACKMASQNPNAVMLAITTFDGPPDLGSSDIFFVKPRGKDVIHRGDHFVFVPTRWLLNQPVQQRAGFSRNMSIATFSAKSV